MVILNCGYDWKGRRLILVNERKPSRSRILSGRKGKRPPRPPRQARARSHSRLWASHHLLGGRVVSVCCAEGAERQASQTRRPSGSPWGSCGGVPCTASWRGLAGRGRRGSPLGWLLGANRSSRQKRLLFKLKRILLCQTTIHPLLSLSQGKWRQPAGPRPGITTACSDDTSPSPRAVSTARGGRRKPPTGSIGTTILSRTGGVLPSGHEVINTFFNHCIVRRRKLQLPCFCPLTINPSIMDD